MLKRIILLGENYVQCEGLSREKPCKSFPASHLNEALNLYSIQSTRAAGLLLS